jgi:hypothetical protein
MLTIGGFMYIFSAGNAASATTAKNIIRDALVGLLVVMFAWLLLFVINPDLVQIDRNLAFLQSLQSNVGPGGSINFGLSTNIREFGTPGQGNGRCQPAASGACSVERLRANGGDCFGAGIEAASAVCQGESGGVTGSLSRVDKCTDGNPFSVGLFQINLTVHRVGNLNCPAAFSGKNFSCRVIDQALYERCVSAAQNAGEAIRYACSGNLSSNGRSFRAWTVGTNCGYR